MNNKIKEIADESGFYISYKNKDVTNKELEFFTDLIIAKCMLLCIADIADPRDTTELKCATRIREYFYET